MSGVLAPCLWSRPRRGHAQSNKVLGKHGAHHVVRLATTFDLHADRRCAIARAPVAESGGVPGEEQQGGERRAAKPCVGGVRLRLRPLALRCCSASATAVTLPLGVVAPETGGEHTPEIQIDPVASVSHKTRGLCALQDTLLTICFFLYGDWQRGWKFLFSVALASVVVRYKTHCSQSVSFYMATGSVAGSFYFLWCWRLLLVGRYPPACWLQQPLASLSFTTSTNS